MKLHRYGHLEEVVVKRADRQLYKLKEGDFIDLHLNDIEDMLILAVQHKLFHLKESDIVDFIVALRIFTRSLIIKRRVEDLQIGVESYEKKLNITAPHQTFLEIDFKELYTPSYKLPGKMAPKKRAIRASAATTTTTTALINAQLKVLINQDVVIALATRDADRSINSDESHNSGTCSRRTERTTHKNCISYQQLYSRMSNKFATCTLQGIALTWWNSHIKTVTHDVAYATKLKTLKKIMTDKYCLRGDIKKLEIEMWNLKVKGTDVCANYKRVGHLTQDSRSPTTANNQRNLTFYECGNQGHYKSDCPELKNRNHGNQVGGTGARGMVHALGRGESNQDPQHGG
nr:hypothetical protein [Tanacetum cinerariifolium]